MQGAGVPRRRACGFRDPSEVDPFLLFDDFRNDDPARRLQALPSHPGIAKFTFVLDGTVTVHDSLDNTGHRGEGSVP